MTDSYNQDNINLRDATPISVRTVSDTSLFVALGEISDGQTLVVNMWGGGSDADPTMISINNYVLGTATVNFTRVAGTGLAQPGGTEEQYVGGQVFVLFKTDDEISKSVCEVEIIGPIGITYNHRLKYSAIRF